MGGAKAQVLFFMDSWYGFVWFGGWLRVWLGVVVEYEQSSKV